MSAKTTSTKPKRKKSKPSRWSVDGASTISMATGNLINMVVVCAVSGTVLLGLLAARHFEAGAISSVSISSKSR